MCGLVLPTVVDYLSLDVEGYEEQALASRGGLFERYTFRVMTIERPSPTLRRRLQAHGYQYVSYKLGCYDQLWVHQSRNKLCVSGFTRRPPATTAP